MKKQDQETEPVEVSVKVMFTELDDDQVQAEFPAVNGNKPFRVVFKNMTWEFVERLESIQQAEGTDDVKVVLDLWRDFVVGGLRAVPLKQTWFVFEAISQYVQQAMAPSKN